MGEDGGRTCCVGRAIADWIRYIESAILRFKGVGFWMSSRSSSVYGVCDLHRDGEAGTAAG
jgi:hypothetical protein